VVIPALHVNAPVLPVKAPGGVLIPPSDPQELGWWAGGAKPGAARGSALVTGHTVHTGGGALDDLETLHRGDRVTVRTDRHRLRYVVRHVAVYSKGSVAKHAKRLFSQQVPGRLVLITCEDWNGVRYLSNVVVVATPVAE
jgi:LPXTG-site transpeptidase (sortase) family protein